MARNTSAFSVAVVAVIVPGLFATVALPAYALPPVEDGSAAQASAELQQTRLADAQSLVVAGEAAPLAIGRDAFTATSAAEIAAALAASSSPSGNSYLANPPYPSFSLDQVVAIALQYQGVPYVFGGASPAGFDCSGFVQFVYAQVGVGLGHGVGSQSNAGTLISPAAALPGDVVILSDGSHDGIWMGGGMILDAPQPGGVVSVRSLWTSSYYIVRFGI